MQPCVGLPDILEAVDVGQNVELKLDVLVVEVAIGQVLRINGQRIVVNFGDEPELRMIQEHEPAMRELPDLDVEAVGAGLLDGHQGVALKSGEAVHCAERYTATEEELLALLAAPEEQLDLCQHVGVGDHTGEVVEVSRDVLNHSAGVRLPHTCRPARIVGLLAPDEGALDEGQHVVEGFALQVLVLIA